MHIHSNATLILCMRYSTPNMRKKINQIFILLLEKIKD